MSKVRAGITFEFDLTEIQEEYPEMTPEDIEIYIRGLATEDIERFVKFDELYEVIEVTAI